MKERHKKKKKTKKRKENKQNNEYTCCCYLILYYKHQTSSVFMQHSHMLAFFAPKHAVCVCVCTRLVFSRNFSSVVVLDFTFNSHSLESFSYLFYQCGYKTERFANEFSSYVFFSLVIQIRNKMRNVCDHKKVFLLIGGYFLQTIPS